MDASNTLSEPNSLANQSVSRKRDSEKGPKEGHREAPEGKRSAKEKRTSKAFLNVQHDLPPGLKNASERDFKKSMDASETLSEPNYLANQSVSRKRDSEKRPEEVHREEPESKRSAKERRTSKAFLNVQHDLPSGLKNASERDFRKSMDVSETLSEPNYLDNQSTSKRPKTEHGEMQQNVSREARESGRIAKGKPSPKVFMNLQHDLPPGLNNASKKDFERPFAKESSEKLPETNSLRCQSLSRRHKDEKGRKQQELLEIASISHRKADEMNTMKPFENAQHDLPRGLVDASKTEFKCVSGENPEPNYLTPQSVCLKPEKAKEEPCKELNSVSTAKEKCVSTVCRSSRDEHAWVGQRFEEGKREVATKAEPKSVAENGTAAPPQDTDLKTAMNVLVETETAKADTDRVTTTDSLIENKMVKTTEVIGNQTRERITWTIRKRIVERTDEWKREPGTPGPRKSGQSITWKGKRKEKLLNKEELAKSSAEKKLSDVPSNLKRNLLFEPPPNMDFGTPLPNDSSAASSQPNSSIVQSVSSTHEHVRGPIQKEKPGQRPDNVDVSGKRTKSVLTNVLYGLPIGLKKATNWVMERPLAKGSSRTESEPNSLLSQSVSRRHKDAEVLIQKEKPRNMPESEGAREKKTTETFMSVQHDLPSGLENASRRIFENQSSGTIFEPNSLLGQSISRRHKDAEIPIQKEEPRDVHEREDAKKKPTSKAFMSVQHDLPIGLENASKRVFENQPSGTSSEPNSLLGQSISRRHKDAEVSIEKEEPRIVPESEGVKEKPTKKTFMSVQHDLPIGLENASKRVFENQPSGTSSEPNSLLGQSISRRYKDAEVPIEKEESKEKPTTKTFMNVQHDLPIGLENASRRVFENRSSGTNSEPNSLLGQSMSRRHKDAEVSIEKEEPKEKPTTKTFMNVQHDLPFGMENASKRVFENQSTGANSEPNSLFGQQPMDEKGERWEEVPTTIPEGAESAKEKRTLRGYTNVQYEMPFGLSQNSRLEKSLRKDRPLPDSNSLMHQRPDKKRDEGTLQYKDRRKEHKKRKRPSVTCCRKRRAMKRAQREGQDLSRKEKFKETGGRRKNKKERHRSPRRAKDRSSRGTNDRYVPMSNAPSEQPDQPPRTASASRRSEPLSAKTPDEPNSLLEQNLDNEGDVAAPQRDEEPHMEHTKKNGPSLSCCCKRRATRRIAIRAGKEGKDIDTREGRGAMNRPPKSDDSSRREPSDKSRQKSKSSKNEEQNLPPGIASASRRGYKEALSRKGSKTPSEPNSLLEQKLHINPKLAAIPHKEKRLKKHKEHKKNGRLSLVWINSRRINAAASTRKGDDLRSRAVVEDVEQKEQVYERGRKNSEEVSELPEAEEAWMNNERKITAASTRERDDLRSRAAVEDVE
ncbi:unnamed protein product [Nippostrongylus brasiliensis]|uniref:DUF4592 domain-containing protein n=1 Tax=Nippostrongylus brasiliensis TaxID=27835 RepID=A0A0N4YFY4_NIPBR|nr:unnamed protein product [Nippostrongylus brasiliensis]